MTPRSGQNRAEGRMGGPGGRPPNMKTENQTKKLIGGVAQFLAAFGFYLTSSVQSKELTHFHARAPSNQKKDVNTTLLLTYLFTLWQPQPCLEDKPLLANDLGRRFGTARDKLLNQPAGFGQFLSGHFLFQTR